MDPSILVAQSVLEPHESALVEVIERSWLKWMALEPETRAILNTSDRTRAAMVWSFIIDQANGHFHPMGIVGMKEFGTVTYRLNPLVRLRFKKMNEDGITRNYRTRRARWYNGQLPLPECPEPIRIDVGYVLNDLKSRIDRILVSCPDGRGVRWVYALTESATVLPLFSEQEQAETRRPLVRPRTPEEPTEREATDGEETT
jgi:hypothetical protein